MRSVSVVGARPNFMKIAPLREVFGRHPGSRHILVHPGRYYDVRMSGAFCQKVNIPAPDIHLNIGSGSHGEKVVEAETLDRIADILIPERLS